MTIGNRYELIDAQEFLQQDCLNVYFYRQITGAAGNAPDLTQAWVAAILPAVLAIQSTALNHVAVGTKNLDLPTDFDFAPVIPPAPGLVAGDPMPPFVAFAFRLHRMQTDIHHGAKRYAGVPEPWVSAGVADASILATLFTLAGVLDDNLVGASGATYEPRIMRRLLDAQGHLIGYEDFPMGIATFVRVSSQNTRKFGRGD